jgi:hypothetical protein
MVKIPSQCERPADVEKGEHIPFMIYPEPKWMGDHPEDDPRFVTFCSVAQFVPTEYHQVKGGNRTIELWVKIEWESSLSNDKETGWVWALYAWENSTPLLEQDGKISSKAREWLEIHQNKIPNLQADPTPTPVPTPTPIQ